jgi:LPS export ABC transporter protein LptC
MAVAAAIVACSGADRPPTAMSASADSADQVVFGLNHQLTIDGILRTRVQSDTAYFYQISQKVAMRHIKVTFYSTAGAETSTLTADSGMYEWRTQNMEARGNVVGVTPDHRRLVTSVLYYDRNSHTITGPAAFVFDAPERHLQGDGFTSDPEFRNVVTQRARKGTVGKVQLEP